MGGHKEGNVTPQSMPRDGISTWKIGEVPYSTKTGLRNPCEWWVARIKEHQATWQIIFPHRRQAAHLKPLFHKLASLSRISEMLNLASSSIFQYATVNGEKFSAFFSSRLNDVIICAIHLLQGITDQGLEILHLVPPLGATMATKMACRRAELTLLG